MKFKTQDQALALTSTIFVIYGEAGVGKSTLANTANKPLVLDFDEGYQRSKLSKDCYEHVHWRDIANDSMLVDIIKDYETIVIDTAGTMLDSIMEWHIETNPKLERMKMQLFGELKNTFHKFLKLIRSLNKDIIFIMHSKQVTESEQLKVKPLAQGSSYDLIIQKADMVGYMFKDDKGNTVLDFDAKDWKVGKNSAELPAIIIPHYNELESFMAGIFEQTKIAFNYTRLNHTESLRAINNIIETANKCESVESINAIMNTLTESTFTKGEKMQIWNSIKTKAESLGFNYDVKSKQFTVVQS
jgi:hypothetical protein